MLLATKVLVGFLRGPLTNLDTPPVASDIRSILVRPPMIKDETQLSMMPSLFHYSSRGRFVKQDGPPQPLQPPRELGPEPSPFPTVRARIVALIDRRLK